MLSSHKFRFFPQVAAVAGCILGLSVTTANAQVLFEQNFEAGSINSADAPVWAWPEIFSEERTTGWYMPYGEGDLYEVSSTVAHTGGHSLRLNMDGRNGFCNECGGEFVALTQDDINSGCVSASGSAWGDALYNITNGFSKWSIISASDTQVCFDDTNVLAETLFPGVTSTLSVGDVINLGYACTEASNRTSCYRAETRLRNVSGNDIGYGETFSRRFYLYIPTETVLPDNSMRLGTVLWNKGGVTQYSFITLDVARGSRVMAKTVDGGIFWSDPLLRDQWYYFEEVFVRETADNEGDGQYHLYLAGEGVDPSEPVFSRANLNLGKLKDVKLQGSLGHSNVVSGYIYYDDVLLAKQYSGPVSTQKNFSVTKTEDTSDPTCDSTCSLREAVLAANANPGHDTITLPAGEYQLILPGVGEDAGMSGDLDILDDLTIEGAGMAVTTINGMSLERVFDVNQGVGAPISLTIRDMTLSNGSNMQVEGSTERYGAGIAFYGEGVLTVERSKLTQHQASGDGGGAIDLRPLPDTGSPQLVLKDSILSDNCADGGSALSGEGIWTIEDSSFIDNGGLNLHAGACGAKFGGGAIYMQNAAVTVKNSAFVGNAATGGGAIFINQGSLLLSNSTLTQNTATTPYQFSTFPYFNYTNGGGAIEIGGGSVTIKNSTLVGNTTTNGEGGAIYESGSVSIVNSIVTNNTSPSSGQCVGTVTSLGNNLWDDFTECGADLTTDLAGDPGIGELVDGGVAGRIYYPLLGGSQAIDAADNSQCEMTDQLGATRPLDGNGDGQADCDIGAYEVRGYDYGWLRTIFSQEVLDNAGDFGSDVVTDSDGNIYFAGYFHGIADFDSESDMYDDIRENPTYSFSGFTYDWGSSGYLVRINADGSFAWVRTLAGNSDSDSVQAHNVLMGDDGSLYVVGGFFGEINFNAEGGGVAQTSASDSGIFVTKFTNPSATGVQFEGVNFFGDFPLVVESVPNKYGNFDATIQGNTITIVGIDGTDIEEYEEKHGAQADFQLDEAERAGHYQRSKAIVKQMTTDLTTLSLTNEFTSDIRGAVANTVVADNSGNLYIAGRYDRTILFGTAGGGEISSGDAGFVVKLNAAGNHMWSTSFTGEAEESAIGTDGNLILAGTFEGSVSFGSSGSYTAVDGKDMFMVKLDQSNGEFLESHRLGGVGDDRGLAVTAAGEHIFVAGEKAGKAVTYAYRGGSLSEVSETNATGQVNALATALNGNVYTTGQFKGIGADFTPTNHIADPVDAHQIDVFMQNFEPE